MSWPPASPERTLQRPSLGSRGLPARGHSLLSSSKDGRNRGVRRAGAAVSKAWARPMSFPSLQARPKNERPIGNQKIIPAGRVIDG